MKKVLTCLVTLFMTISLQAQDFVVPQGYEFKKDSDYKAYEKDILNAINWLYDTPMNTQKSKRVEVNGFVYKWISGSPSVTVVVSPDLVPYMDSSECFLMFISGWVKYSLENNHSEDALECAYYATKFVISFHKKNIETLGKNSDILRLEKREKKGDLKNYLKSKMP